MQPSALFRETQVDDINFKVASHSNYGIKKKPY